MLKQKTPAGMWLVVEKSKIVAKTTLTSDKIMFVTHLVHRWTRGVVEAGAPPSGGRNQHPPWS